jgi:hypothetical protein
MKGNTHAAKKAFPKGMPLFLSKSETELCHLSGNEVN